MQFTRLQLIFAVGIASQSIDLGGIINAGDSIQSGIQGLSSPNVGAIATIAQSAVNNVQSSPSPTSTRSPTASSSSQASPTTGPSSTSPSSSSTLQTSSSSTSSDGSRLAVAAASSASSTSTPPPDQGKARKNQLLEIILPTVLSGLTLLVLLAILLWYCARRRKQRANRGSGMNHLYAAGSERASEYYSPAMQERQDDTLLHRTSSPALAAAAAHHHGHDTAYVGPHPSGAPAYSAHDPHSRPPSLYPHGTHSGHLSRFSTSNSTNGVSMMAPSNGSGVSNGHGFFKGPQPSYHPVTNEENPAELAAEKHSIHSIQEEGQGLSYSPYSPYTPAPHRARTPPLQAMFPWFGAKNNARASHHQPRVSGLHGRESNCEGPTDFDFAFDRRSHNAGSAHTTPRKSSIRSTFNRFAIPMYINP